jgi:hypothetical protein
LWLETHPLATPPSSASADVAQSPAAILGHGQFR